jgi:hypothetical protein
MPHEHDYTAILRHIIESMELDVDPAALEARMRAQDTLEGLPYGRFRHEAMRTLEAMVTPETAAEV